MRISLRSLENKKKSLPLCPETLKRFGNKSEKLEQNK